MTHSVSSNNKTSYLVASQLPDFVNRDHPKFVEFIEGYYKFLEQEGELAYVTKNFASYMDVDVIAEDIAEHPELVESTEYYQILTKTYQNFIRYIPDTALADMNIIAKHSKEFYRTTGSEKSIRYIARILFNKDADIYYPQDNILKASDGKWFVEKSLNIRDIAVNGVANTDAFTRFINTTIRGNTSNSTAKVESVDAYYDATALVTELKVSGVEQDFINGEKLFCYIEDEGITKELSANLYSGIIVKVTVVTPGSGYTQGASVPIIPPVGFEGNKGTLIISKVVNKKLEGSIKAVDVIQSGAGFVANTNLLLTGGGGTGAAANVFTVQDDETYHPAYYDIVASQIIEVADTQIANTVDTNEGFAYSNLNTIYTISANLTINVGAGGTQNVVTLSDNMSNSNVYFETGDFVHIIETNTTHRIVESNRYYNELNLTPGLAGSQYFLSFEVVKKPNANSIVAQSMNYWSYGPCGPIISTAIINPGKNYIELPTVSALSNTFVRSLGILGKMEIYDGGTGYANGDIIQFINKPGTYGVGANAQVSLVNATGTILQVSFLPLEGHLPGGSGYRQDVLPDINILTSGGTNANIAVTACIADGSELVAKSDIIGGIEEIKIVSGGYGYETPPTLDLTGLGDGTANAFANVVTGVYSYPGRYLNQDGQLSSYMFLQNRDYYQKYSYVIKMSESMDNYRQAMMDLIHPAGLKMYGQYLFQDNDETGKLKLDIANTFIASGVNTSNLIVFFDPVNYYKDHTNNNTLANTVWYNAANTKQYANIANVVVYSSMVYGNVTNTSTNANTTIMNYSASGFKFLSANSLNNSIIMNHANSLNVSNLITVAAWFYQDKANAQYKTVVSKQNPTFTRGFEINSQNNDINIIVRPYTANNILKLTSNANANSWYMAAFTYDGTHARGYFNGQFVGITDGVSNGATDTANNLYIGCRNDAANTMNGRISIVEIYNRPFSNTEMINLFNKHRGRFGL